MNESKASSSSGSSKAFGKTRVNRKKDLALDLTLFRRQAEIVIGRLQYYGQNLRNIMWLTALALTISVVLPAYLLAHLWGKKDGATRSAEYPPWWTSKGFLNWFRNLPEDTLWNCYICVLVLVELGRVAANPYCGWFVHTIEIFYNISYAVHVLAIGYRLGTELEDTDYVLWSCVGLFMDTMSYVHYVTNNYYLKIACYYVRLHRPLVYLWSLNDYNLKGSVLGTTLKYCYIFMVLRITWAWIWLHINMLQEEFSPLPRPIRRKGVQIVSKDSNESDASKFISSLYIVNKMFIPIGMPVPPQNDIERLTCLLVIISGCIVVTGAAVASLSLVISLYMSPEETFRSRYKLIIKDMKDSHVPASLRAKVKKFYRMYWHKQRAVSATKLLPTFPPTLPATVYLDIYFEATQKSRILRDLSYQFLSELAKRVETIHYIPGDAIIKRNERKSAFIYITYGDIEMLTAEDDVTAILRFTRGTVLNPCGGAVAAAACKSHLRVRAATFCTAHVLKAADLWRVVLKYSAHQNHGKPINSAFKEHINRVKRHYAMKIPGEALQKSSILHFNRNLLALKEMKDAKGNSLLANPDVFLEIANCYIMRNRLESTLTDESDEICLRQTFPCIVRPWSSLLLAWHSAVSVLIVCICIIYPYNLVYKKEVGMSFTFFEYINTLIFVVDHIVRLSTGAHVEEGVPITFAQTSSQQMRSKWFVLDLVGTLPIFEIIGDGHFGGINKILRLPKVFRVLNVIEEKCVYHRNLLRFCSYTLLLLIACYLIAAMQQAFMCFQSGYCLVTNFTHSPYWEKKELDEETVRARITFGLYWAISMIMFTTHIETWGKDDMSNVMYTIIIIEVCIVLRTFMEAVYSATIMVTTALREDYDARIATVRHFLIRNEVDPELRKRFITYLQLCWYTDKAYKMTHKKNASIFHDLPGHVYQDIVGRHRLKYVLSIRLFKILKTEELTILASHAHLFYTSPNEILMNTGDLVNEIYVIVKGICEVISPKTRNTICHLTANHHFGVAMCLLRLPAYYTVRAVTHVQIFCISKRHLKAVFDNPQIKEALEYVKTTPEYTLMQQRQPSFLTYVPLPPTPNLERFKLPRKYEPDYEFLHPFKNLGFFAILRYIFPRFTIRPDGNYLMRYEWLRVSCALVSSIVFPNYTYLVLQWPWLYYFTLLLDLSAMFDIFQRMLVGYYNEDGILIYHPSSTAAYYMKGPFITDLFGCLPLEKLETETVHFDANMYQVTPVEQFLMMNRLVQLYRFPSIMQTLQNYIERRDILMVINAVPLFISMFNILTCLMIFNSVKIYFFKDDYGITGWLLKPFKDPGGSWIDHFSSTFRFNLISSPFNLYLATHFWVVYETTTTGYGKFKPSNQALMQILFLGMTMCGMIITYFSVRIISIRSNVNKAHAGFQQHMRDIIAYMKKENLDPELQNELRLYYEYNWEKMGGIDYRGVLKLCEQLTLRSDAILHIYGPTFAKCPLFAQCDISLLRMIGRSVRSVYFLRDMKIIEYDDVVNSVYFVDYGGVESRVPIGTLSQAVRLPRGSLFGNLEAIPAQRVPMNIVATSRLHLLKINSQAFYQIINEFPTTKALLELARMTDNQHYILGNIEDFKVKLDRGRDSIAPPPPTTRRDIIKYIYFQEGLVLLYLILVSLICIFMDLYNAGYQDNRAWLILTLYILDMCFFLKILMQFALPLLVTKRSFKTLLLPLRRMYFKREFKYDMMSCVPIELFAFHGEEDRWLLFSWLRINRMFRIVTVNNCLKRRNERIKVNLIASTILTVTIWFSLFVHASTCIWYFIGRLEEQKEHKSSWIYTDEGLSWCRNEYICSLYFVITTFTQNGVGDIMPKKQSEVIFVTILMIISTLVFMMYVGEFSKLIQYQSFRSFSFYSQYLELQEFLKNNRVSKNLVNIVNKYTLHLWRTSRGMQVPRFLKKAPLSLRLRVMSAAYLHHLENLIIFKDCEPAFLRQLVGCLRLYHYNENMYVVKEGDITDSMYFIHSGKVQEIATELKKAPISKMFLSKSCFGIGLVRDTPYTNSYQTTNKSQVLTLHLDDWEYLLAHFPESKASIHKHMKQAAGKDVDSSKWPGGEDPEPRPESVSQTEKDTGVSNLPNFFPYDNRRMFEAGPSGHYTRHNSTESSASYLSKDLLNTDEAKTRKSLRRMTSDSLSPSLGGGPNEDKTTSVLVPESSEYKSKEKHYVGILKTISNILKKLMGRYSGMDLTREETEAEEEATQALLKQLDEARRLIGEMEKKNRYRSNKRVDTFPKEEDTEKYVLSLDKSSLIGDPTEEPLNSATLLPRPLQIRDKRAHTITHENDRVKIDSSESSQTTDLTQDVDAASIIGTSTDFDSKPKDEIDDNVTSIDKSKAKENPQIVNKFEELEKEITSNNQEKDSNKIDEKVEELPYQVTLDATSYIAEAPDWMTKEIQENDADIEDIPDNQSKQDLKEDANSQDNLDKPVSSEPENNTIRNSQISPSSNTQVTQETDADIEPLPISAPVNDGDVDSNEKSNNKISITQDKLQSLTLTDLKSPDNQGLSGGIIQDRPERHSQTSKLETEDADIEMIASVIDSQSDIDESQQQQLHIIEIKTVPDADIKQEELKVPSEELPLTNNLRPVSSRIISSQIDENTLISSTTNIAKDDKKAEIPNTSKDTPTSILKRRKPFIPIRYDDEEPTSSKSVSQNKDQDTEETAKSEAKVALDSSQNKDQDTEKTAKSEAKDAPDSSQNKDQDTEETAKSEAKVSLDSSQNKDQDTEKTAKSEAKVALDSSQNKDQDTEETAKSEAKVALDSSQNKDQDTEETAKSEAKDAPDSSQNKDQDTEETAKSEAKDAPDSSQNKDQDTEKTAKSEAKDAPDSSQNKDQDNEETAKSEAKVALDSSQNKVTPDSGSEPSSTTPKDK